MKKLVLVLAALLLASPAMSALTVECEDLGSLQCGVKYTADTAADLGRGFALSISLDSGATIASIDEESAAYWVNPENIVITGGVVTDEGSAVVAGGTGQASMVVEMGSLHYPADVNSVNAPALTGYLVKFTASAACTVTVDADASRSAGGSTGVVDYAAASKDAGLPTTCDLVDGGCCGGDTENDGDIDLDDYNAMKGKLFLYNLINGTYTIPGAAAEYDACYDWENDNDIDLDDYNAMKGALFLENLFNGEYIITPGDSGWPCN
jgi:hypothetical protein